MFEFIFISLGVYNISLRKKKTSNYKWCHWWNACCHSFLSFFSFPSLLLSLPPSLIPSSPPLSLPSLYSESLMLPGWDLTPDPLTSAFQMLRLQAWTSIPILTLFFSDSVFFDYFGQHRSKTFLFSSVL